MVSTGSTPDDAAPEEPESDKHTSSQGRSEGERFICIKNDADLVLNVEISPGDEHILYLVITTELQASSLYFRNLLDPEKFSEGVRVSAIQRTLRDRYRSWRDVPPNELPRILITDIGHLSGRVRYEELMTSFLRILLGVHSQKIQPTPAWLANLVVVADRFDGLKSLRDFVRTHHGPYTAIATKWLNSAYKEEPIRQILLSGMLLNISQWVTSCSARLVNHGSPRWDAVAEGVDEEPRALWWTLPNGFEGAFMSISQFDILGLTYSEEVMYRRESILNTLNDLQGYFLKAYTSKQRQCKLGYDSSAQCDSFQLGEMVRFFTRVGTLRLQGMIYDDGDPPFFMGSIDKMLDKLRQCPSYQINKHHSHCGLRARLLPVIELIQGLLESEAGICGNCWVQGNAGLMWSQHPRAKHWTYSRTKILSKNKCERHDQARDMFTAHERDWEPPSTSVS